MGRVMRAAGVPDDVPVTYAGRLDPMAEGLVIFLVGEMRYQKERMLHLDKTYDVSFFTGCETDTFDVLGVAQISSCLGGVPERSEGEVVSIPPRPSATPPKQEEINAELTLKTINEFQPTGTFSQAFPSYSSRKVGGKSLFAYARASEIVLNEFHNVTIHNYSNFKTSSISSSELVENICADIKKVEGDFRQQEISASWKALEPQLPSKVDVHHLTISCGSGFYVRQWVSDLGRYLSTGAVTLSIVRVTIGVFTMSMLNGEPYRVFHPEDPEVQHLTK